MARRPVNGMERWRDRWYFFRSRCVVHDLTDIGTARAVADMFVGLGDELANVGGTDCSAMFMDEAAVEEPYGCVGGLRAARGIGWPLERGHHLGDSPELLRARRLNVPCRACIGAGPTGRSVRGPESPLPYKKLS